MSIFDQKIVPCPPPDPHFHPAIHPCAGYPPIFGTALPVSFVNCNCALARLLPRLVTLIAMSHVSPSPSPSSSSRSCGGSSSLSPRPCSCSRGRSPPTFLDPQRLRLLVAHSGTRHSLVRRHDIAKQLFVVYAQNQIVYHPICFGELFFP